MSTLESFIWHLLGYAAIPIILIGGLFLATLLFYLLVNFFGRGSEN